MTASWRNVVIFVVGAYALSITGGVLSANGHDIGGLVFIVGPIAMAVVLRVFAREGWKTAGLRANLRGHLVDFTLSLLVFPTLVAVSLVLGAAFGTLTLADEFVARYFPAILAVLPFTMLYAIFEEFGWRGYLEPQLEILSVPDLPRHLLVGLIWTAWHIPYLLTFGDVAEIPIYLFVPIYLAAILAMAVWYGVSRKRTNSVWPAVIAHGCANGMMWPLIMDDMIDIHDHLWISPRPDAVVSTLLLIGVASFVWRRRLV